MDLVAGVQLMKRAVDAQQKVIENVTQERDDAKQAHAEILKLLDVWAKSLDTFSQVQATKEDEAAELERQLQCCKEELTVIGEQNYSLVQSLGDTESRLAESKEESMKKETHIKELMLELVQAQKYAHELAAELDAFRELAAEHDASRKMKSAGEEHSHTTLVASSSDEAASSGAKSVPVNGVEAQNDEKELLAELDALRKNLDCMIKENQALSVFNQEAEESMKELTEDLRALQQDKDSIVKEKEYSDNSFEVLRQKCSSSLQEKDQCIKDLRAEVDALHQKSETRNECKNCANLMSLLHDAQILYETSQQHNLEKENSMKELTAAMDKATMGSMAALDTINLMFEEKESLLRSLRDADNTVDLLRKKMVVSLQDAETRLDACQRDKKRLEEERLILIGQLDSMRRVSTNSDDSLAESVNL